MKKFKDIREQTEVSEGPLVMADADILDTVWNQVKKQLEKDLKKGDVERINLIARWAKFKITKSRQARGRSFRYDLKR